MESMRHSSDSRDPQGCPGAPVPRAVPPIRLDGALQFRHAAAPVIGELPVAAVHAEFDEAANRGHREPAEPDALSDPASPDAVHPVVPIAGAHEWQVVQTAGDAAFEGPLTMLED